MKKLLVALVALLIAASPAFAEVAGGFVIGFFTAKYGGLYGNGIKSLTNFAQMLRNY